MDNKEIRRRNIDLLTEQAGGPAEMGRKLGRDPNQISQWRGGKGIGDRLARALEEQLGKPKGWLDTPNWNLPPGLAAVLSQSQPPRLTVATVVNTTEAIKLFLGRRGIEYDPITHAELFVSVYNEAAKLSATPSLQETMKFASVVTELIEAKIGAA